MTKQMTREEAKADILATFEEGIAKLQACTLQDEIYAWDNGLAVKFDFSDPDNMICHACSIADATPAERGWMRVFRNGNGEVAGRVKRQDAIAKEIAQLRAHIETFAAM